MGKCRSETGDPDATAHGAVGYKIKEIASKLSERSEGKIIFVVFFLSTRQLTLALTALKRW